MNNIIKQINQSEDSTKTEKLQTSLTNSWELLENDLSEDSCSTQNEWGSQENDSLERKPWLDVEQILMDPWEEEIVQWLNEESNLTKSQRKLNIQCLNALKKLQCYYGVYNFYTDLEYDRPGTQDLKDFLEEHKSNPDLKVVLNLKRGKSKTTILHMVATLNIDAVDSLLDAGANPNVKDSEGKTPLHYASEYDQCDGIIKYLLEEGARVDIQDNKGKTPLHYASKSDQCDNIIKYLLQKGARVDIQDNKENTPLHYAALCENENGIKLLVEKNQGINLTNEDSNTALHLALYCNDTRVAEAILDVRGKVDVSKKNREGLTPLLLASALSSTKLVNSILDRRAKPNIQDNKGNTALHFAVCNNFTGYSLKTTIKHDNSFSSDNDSLDNGSLNNDDSEDTAIKNVNVLMSAGIDINVQNNSGNTPLFFAVEAMKSGAVKHLLLNGAKVKVRDKYGYTPFHYAIKTRNLEILKELLPYEVDSNGIESDKIDKQKVRKLLSNTIDNQGNTLLHHATKLGCNQEILNFLVDEGGIDINAKNKNGVAAIHIAAKYGKDHLIDFFIENKADLNARCRYFTESEIENTKDRFVNVQDNTQGSSSVIDVKSDFKHKAKTPVSIASDNNHESTVYNLLKRGVNASISDKQGWLPIHIAIKKACDSNSTKEERESAYNIIEKLAKFSNVKNYEPQGITSKMFSKIKELFTGTTQDISLMQAAYNDERIRKILCKSREMKELSTAPIFEANDPLSNDSFYSELGSYVKEIPKLYPDLSKELKKIDETQLLDEFQEVGIECQTDEMKKVSETKTTRIEDQQNTNPSRQSDEHQQVTKDKNQCNDKRLEMFKQVAKSAARKGNLIHCEVNDINFHVEYSRDSIVEVVKIIEGGRELGLYNGNIKVGGNIIKIGESQVEVEVDNEIRNYTDLSDDSDITVTFQTSLGPLEVRLHHNVEDKNKVKVEVYDQEKFKKLVNKGEEIGKNCLLGGISVCEAIENGYFLRKFVSSEVVKGLKDVVSDLESINVTSFNPLKSSTPIRKEVSGRSL